MCDRCAACDPASWPPMVRLAEVDGLEVELDDAGRPVGPAGRVDALDRAAEAWRAAQEENR